jgi:hypothetical protein
VYSICYCIYTYVKIGIVTDLIVRFQVLTAASMKMTDLWDLSPYSLVKVYRLFRSANSLHHNCDDGCNTHL